LKLRLYVVPFLMYSASEWRDLENGSFKVIENGAVR